MKYVIFAILFAFGSAGRLDNQYLPPSSAGSSGGDSSLLGAPSRSSLPLVRNSNVRPNNNYIPPVANDRSTGAYLPPSPQAGFGSSQPLASSGGYGGGFANQNIGIIRLDNNNGGDGSYSYILETENGIQQQESGQLQNQATIAQGSYTYTSPEGQRITVNYVADENGFQASGDHIPTAPPVPEAILKALEINAEHEAAGIFDDGQYRPQQQQQNANGSGQGQGSPSRQYLGPQAGQSSQAGGYRY